MTTFEKDLMKETRQLRAALQWALPLAIEAAYDVCVSPRAEAELDSRVAYARSALMTVGE